MHAFFRGGIFPEFPGNRLVRTRLLCSLCLSLIPTVASATSNFDACIDDAKQAGSSITTDGYVSYRCEHATAEKLSARPDECPVGHVRPALESLARRQQQLDDGLLTTVTWTAGRCTGSCVMRSFDFKDTTYACEVRTYSRDVRPPKPPRQQARSRPQQFQQPGPQATEPEHPEAEQPESQPEPQQPRVAGAPFTRQPRWSHERYSQPAGDYEPYPYPYRHRYSDWSPLAYLWRLRLRPRYWSDRLEGPHPRPRFWWGPKWDEERGPAPPSHGWPPPCDC